MIDIRFEINGRRVNPNSIGNELEQAIYQNIKRQISNKLKGVRDPVTGRPPKITAKGRSLSRLKFQVEGSPEVIKLVERRLR